MRWAILVVPHIAPALKLVVDSSWARSALRVRALSPPRLTIALTESWNSSASIHAYAPNPSTLFAPTAFT